MSGFRCKLIIHEGANTLKLSANKYNTRIIRVIMSAMDEVKYVFLLNSAKEKSI